MVNSRAKGAAGEREFAHWLTDHGFPASRGCQFQGGPDSPDIRCTILPVHFEVKRVEAFNAYESLAQAQRDCGGKISVVAHRRNNRDWIAVLPMHNLIALVAAHAQEKRESD